MSVNHDGTIKFWNVNNGNLLRLFKLPKKEIRLGVALSRDNKMFAVGSGLDSITIWNVQTGDVLNSLYTKAMFTFFTGSVGFSPDGKILAAGIVQFKGDGISEMIQFWDTRTWEPILKTKASAYSGEFVAITLLAFSPDGKFIALGGADKMIKLWKIQMP